MIDYSDLFSYADIKFIKEELDCIAEQNIFIFENAIKETIDQLEKKHNDFCKKEHEALEEIKKIEQKIDNEKLNDAEIKELNQQKTELYHKKSNYYFEYLRIREELKSLSEMLIIYAFKNIEINIKTLIKIAYPSVNTKDFFKWESLSQFFKTKKIEIAKLKSYREILNLKDVNNNIKHKNIVDENIKSIPEFKDLYEFDYTNLMNFYERVKNEVPVFLLDLANQIKKDLFEFDNSRIIEISNEFKFRMSDEKLKILVKNLTEK